MSPMLFNVYVEQPIQKIKKKLNSENIGVIVEKLIQMLRFTDDITLITKNKKKMQRSFEEYNLKINWKKTKVMLCQKIQ